jgi:ParB/RepB/Spo0J family partition protein
VSKNPDAIVVKETKKIPIDKIQVSSFHVRQSGVTEGLEILAKTILKVGLIQPVVVYEIEGGMYELIAGQRRFLAHKEILKWTEIMAMIIEKPTSDMLRVLCSWNEGMSTMKLKMKDKIRFIQGMYDERISIREISKQLGISTKEVKAGVGLLGVPDVVRDAVVNGEISADLAVRATDARDFEKYETSEDAGADVLDLCKKIQANKLSKNQQFATLKFGELNPDATNEEIMQGGIDNTKVTIHLDLTSSDNRRLERYAENNGLSLEAARSKLILDTLDETEE